jgi:hypothetical protein
MHFKGYINLLGAQQYVSSRHSYACLPVITQLSFIRFWRNVDYQFREVLKLLTEKNFDIYWTPRIITRYENMIAVYKNFNKFWVYKKCLILKL